MHFNRKQEKRDDVGITLMQRLAMNNMQTYAYFINFNEIYFLLIRSKDCKRWTKNCMVHFSHILKILRIQAL